MRLGDDFSIFFDEVSGELVLDNATSVDGKIVYLVLIPNSFYTTVKELQNRGSIGILTAESGGKSFDALVSFFQMYILTAKNNLKEYF